MNYHPSGLASPYALYGAKLISKGYSAIPIMVGTKRPDVGSDWTRFCIRLPTQSEVDLWSMKPDIGVGIALGAASGGTVAIDIDSDDPGVVNAVEAVCGASPVKKRGRKGYTAFFRATAAVGSKAFKFAEGGGVDLLAHGRQTVLPPTVHPDTGKPYAWVSVDTLEHVRPEHLPELPDDIADRLAEVLAPFGYVAEPERSATAHTDGCDDRWRETNEAALAKLDSWVPHLFAGAKRDRAGWRAKATWRNGEGFNVSFHPKGIRDFATSEGYSPIDIVAKVVGCDPCEAMRLLRDKLGLRDPEPVEFLLRMKGDDAAEEPAPSAGDDADRQAEWLKADAVLLPDDKVVGGESEPFPVWALGLVLEGATNALVESAQCQPSLAAASLFAHAAGAVQAIVNVRTVRGKLLTTMGLIAIAESSEGKSLVWAVAAAPFHEFDKWLESEHASFDVDYKARMIFWKKEHDKASRGVAGSDPDEIKAAVEKLAEIERRKPVKPNYPSVTFPGGGTLEGLINSFRTQVPSSVSSTAEGAQFFRGAAFGDKNAAASASMAIDLIDTGGGGRDLMGDGSADKGRIRLRDVRFSQITAVQPAVIAPVLTGLEQAGQGYHARYLKVAPEPIAHEREFDSLSVTRIDQDPRVLERRRGCGRRGRQGLRARQERRGVAQVGPFPSTILKASLNRRGSGLKVGQKNRDRPFRGMLSVHSRCGPHTRSGTYM